MVFSRVLSRRHDYYSYHARLKTVRTGRRSKATGCVRNTSIIRYLIMYMCLCVPVSRYVYVHSVWARVPSSLLAPTPGPLRGWRRAEAGPRRGEVQRESVLQRLPLSPRLFFPRPRLQATHPAHAHLRRRRPRRPHLPLQGAAREAARKQTLAMRRPRRPIATMETFTGSSKARSGPGSLGLRR